MKAKTLILKFYQDPAHGWIAVKQELLSKLGIAGKISSYSYVRGTMAYLEEDMDASILIKALDAASADYEIKAVHTNRKSCIRNYEAYPRLMSTNSLREGKEESLAYMIITGADGDGN